MLIASLTGWCHHHPSSTTATDMPVTGIAASLTIRQDYCNPRFFRYPSNGNQTDLKKYAIGGLEMNHHHHRSSSIGDNKMNITKKKKISLTPMANSTLASTNNTSSSDLYQEVIKVARQKFTQEISFQSKDKDISLARVLMYIAAEDEAFVSYNREMDGRFVKNEREDTQNQSENEEWEYLETMPLGGKNINGWLTELDSIAKEVEAELVSREIGCHFVEVLEAVNVVLFGLRGFKRSPVLVDPKYCYLHSVLSDGCGSAILLSIIYIEVCRRLNLTIVGSRVGEEFLIWPQMGNPEELFKVTSGHSLFGVVNGRCVDDPRSKASDLNSSSLSGLDIATNRDIIGIYLANLIRLHWKRASRMNHGLMLTSPLRPVHDQNELNNNNIDSSNIPLIRPQDLRFKMLILQVGNEKERGELLLIT
ncbi:uncharacterized protein LOC124930104 isoform X2 [Impatiens glandulifera]|uniref:uncharacterized protein LOC124930104 isoform X2 n=1 Tax=Impatiens glandulifera TaxID=253017 RepID=UPI001FB04C74|nr:uncharacterized protein LOC124930104 isoform X2 [Impatiens glandulifera]